MRKAVGAGTSKKRRARLNQPVEPQPSRADVPHDWEKDDEELELEEALFGTSMKRIKLANGHVKAPVAEDGESGGAGELAEMQDAELFTIDAPYAPGYAIEDGDGSTSSSQSSDDEDSQADSLVSSDEEDSDRPSISLPDDLIDLRSPFPSLRTRKGKEKASLWRDPADELVNVDLNGERRMRKLARGKGGDTKVGGKELEKRLREQFERLHPRPEWANRRTQTGTPSLSSLLATTKSFVAIPERGTRGSLPQGTIEIQRLRNANQQSPTVGKREAVDAGGGVVDFAWHPNPKVGVVAVAGGDRRVRFFNIDGHTNPSLMTLHIPSLPLTRATFHPSGSSLLLTGSRPFYCTYDLPSQRCLRSPRNLFGSVRSPTSPNSLSRHAFSPDGSLLAVAGRRGAVSVLDWSGTGVGAVVAELRSGRGASVVDLVWSVDGRELSVLGGRDGAEVEVWDVGERKVVRKWQDDRAFGGAIMRRSGDGAYTAIGSSTGIVNLYSSTSLNSTSTSTPYLKPEPMRSLEHLITPISSIAFHHSSEILATASLAKRDALRLYHLPSGTAFSNFPTSNTNLGRITSVGFSSGGQYLAVGNQKGSVLLWSLKHFANA